MKRLISHSSLLLLAVTLCLGGCDRPNTRLLLSDAPGAGAAAPSEQPATLPAELTFTDKPAWPVGRVSFTLPKSESIALRIRCELPKPVDKELERSIGKGLQARLALTKRAVHSITPSGTPAFEADPAEYQDAVAGTLICTPTDDPRDVMITVKDLQFRTTKIRQIGPLKIRLDNAPPP